MSSIFSAIASIWNSLLYKLGLWDKQASLLVLGLDNAGKTTLLHSLANGGSHRVFPPTDRPRLMESFRYKGISFRAWDLGGHEAVRHLWADYYDSPNDDTEAATGTSPSSQQTSTIGVSAVLFLVDAADEARLEEAGYELDHLLASSLSEPSPNQQQQQQQQQPDTSSSFSSLHNIPVAILCNKCDLSSAVSSDIICEKLDYSRLEAMHAPNKIALFRISVLTGQGYDEAFQWINSFI
jgi:GTP-binding protein SAR1